MHLPPQLVRNVTEAFPDGANWLECLPALLDDVCARWNLTLGPPFLLSFNYVAPALRADGSEAVLKVGCPHPELLSEIAATRLYEGQGMARLLDADPDRGASLLERVRPGAMLFDYFDPADPRAGRDDEATAIAGQIMRELRRPITAQPPLLTLDHWLSEMAPTAPDADRYPARMKTLRDEALSRYREMTDPAAHVLLHGDLHHYNILSDSTAPLGWRAIDPKGIVGDAGFDVYAWFGDPLNLMEHGDLPGLTRRRVAILADVLETEREVIRAWGFIGQTLSAWWSVNPEKENGGDDWQNAAHVAELLRSA